MTGRRLTPADIGKPGLRHWLETHGLDPRRVAALPGAELEVRDGRVLATVYVVDAHGRKQLDHDGPAAMLVELVDLPLLAPLPDHLGTETP